MTAAGVTMGSIIMNVAVVGIGIVLGLARGGRLSALRSVRPQWWGVLLGGFVLQAFAENVDIARATSLSVIGMFALIVGLVKNAHIRGALIAALGVSLNLVVMALNGAVPIRFEALGAAGIVESATQRSQITSVGHLLELETPDTSLAALGDTIPIGALESVISIGDLITFAGVMVIVSSLIAARRTVGVDVNQVFGLAAPRTQMADEFEPLNDADFPIVSGLAEMFGQPSAPAPGVLDLAADEPIIDIASPQVAPAHPTIDLTFDPDEIWADDDTGVRILGPSSKSSD